MRRAGLLGMVAGVAMGLAAAGMMMPMAMGQWNTPNPVVSFEMTAKGLELKQKDGVLRLEVDADDLVHVTYAPVGDAGAGPAKDWVVVKTDWPAAEAIRRSTLSLCSTRTVLPKGSADSVRRMGVVRVTAPSTAVAPPSSAISLSCFCGSGEGSISLSKMPNSSQLQAKGRRATRRAPRAANSDRVMSSEVATISTPGAIQSCCERYGSSTMPAQSHRAA